MLTFPLAQSLTHPAYAQADSPADEVIRRVDQAIAPGDRIVGWGDVRVLEEEGPATRLRGALSRSGRR